MSEFDPRSAAPQVADDEIDALLDVLPTPAPGESVQDWFARASTRLVSGDHPLAGIPQRLAVDVVQLAASTSDPSAAPPASPQPFQDVEGRVTVRMAGDGTLIEVSVQAGPYVLHEMAGRRYLLMTSGDAPLRVPVSFDVHGAGACFLPDTPSVRRALQRFRLIELDAFKGPK